MMRAVVNWLRLVWPPGWIVALALCSFAAIFGIEYWLVSWIGEDEASQLVALVRTVWAIGFCGLYGCYRVFAFHPLVRPAYGEWLARTPWTSAKPLPNGPIHLVWQDVAMMGLLYVLGYSGQVNPWAVPFALLTSYLVAIGWTFWTLGLKWASYVTALGMGLFVRLIDYPWIAACVIVLIYGVIWLALRRALAQFPWEPVEWLEKFTSTGKTSRTASDQLGWPFDLLRPEPQATGIALADATLLSLLAAWWLYVLISIGAAHGGLRRDGVEPLELLYPFFVLICIVNRVAVYSIGYRPPIGFWGRVFTLRWIIPGYDRILVAPLCAALLGIAVPWGLAACGAPATVVLPCSFSTVLFVTLAMGPTRRQWYLTGNYRLRRSVLSKNTRLFAEL